MGLQLLIRFFLLEVVSIPTANEFAASSSNFAPLDHSFGISWVIDPDPSTILHAFDAQFSAQLNRIKAILLGKFSNLIPRLEQVSNGQIGPNGIG